MQRENENKHVYQLVQSLSFRLTHNKQYVGVETNGGDNDNESNFEWFCQ